MHWVGPIVFYFLDRTRERVYVECKEMGDVVEIRGKTEQRVATVIAALKNARHPVTYLDLEEVTGADYGALLYICSTLVELGYVERVEDEVENRPPGRPVVRFRWKARTGRARAMGAR